MWSCINCKKTWYYPVEECIFCKSHLEQKKSEMYHVVTQTTVHIPTPKHSQVPYHLYLLEGDEGDRLLFKSFIKLDINKEVKWSDVNREVNEQ